MDKAPADSPAIRLLDALRTGDDLGVLAVCGQTTTVSAANMDWSCRGRDEIHRMLEEARRRFPEITFESRTRHIGFGLVIDEARVQDRAAGADADEVAAAERAAAAEEEARRRAVVPDPDIHPMWDEPVPEQQTSTSLRRVTSSGHLRPGYLNMPVRVTVRHDDLQVHEITLSFPAALLKRALGMHVDPLEMSLSEVQSAFIAPVGAGFTTYTLAPPELPPAPPAPPSPQPWTPDEKAPKRRRRLLVPVLVALAVLAAGGWWAVQGKDGNQVAESPVPSPSSTPTTRHSASASPSHRPSSSKAPTVTHGKPSTRPHRKPNITLRSDLAFGFNSSSLSKEAKSAINDVAQQVRRARLTGTIFVDGYTDNIGSAAYGLVLSQRRADAVSKYLGSRLTGVRVDIKSIAHGEADPVADNSTNAGRKANRRVTITLPKP